MLFSHGRLDDLINQLRALARAEHDDLSIAEDAANALSVALDELDQWKAARDAEAQSGYEARGQLREVEAERDRLRAALERIATSAAPWDVLYIARQALSA